MSFVKMKRDDLYKMAVDEFAVDVAEDATKDVIIGALNDQGVTWKMAKTFYAGAAAIESDEEEVVVVETPANVITSASTKPEPVNVSADPADVGVAETATVIVTEPASDVNAAIEKYFVLVPKGVDGFVKNNVFTPGNPTPVAPVQAVVDPNERILVKMERENPMYQVRGYTFTQENPFALVKNKDIDTVLNQDGFKIATPNEAKEFYG